MNGSASEWIAKAEGDFDVAQLAMAAKVRPNYDAVCFHCQQCIERLLKGALLHRDKEPPRVHDLVVLSDLLRPLAPDWMPEQKELRFLSQAAVLFRYPGESATRENAELAIDVCIGMRVSLLKPIR